MNRLLLWMWGAFLGLGAFALFFTANVGLTTHTSAQGTDLYEYNLNSEQLTDVSATDAEGGAEVLGFVGASNSARSGTAIPRWRSRSISDSASRECPPRSKKLSSAPTWSRPRTSAKTPHMISSRTVAGARPDAPAA